MAYITQKQLLKARKENDARYVVDKLHEDGDEDSLTYTCYYLALCTYSNLRDNLKNISVAIRYIDEFGERQSYDDEGRKMLTNHKEQFVSVNEEKKLRKNITHVFEKPDGKNIKIVTGNFQDVTELMIAVVNLQGPEAANWKLICVEDETHFLNEVDKLVKPHYDKIIAAKKVLEEFCVSSNKMSLEGIAYSIFNKFQQSYKTSGKRLTTGAVKKSVYKLHEMSLTDG